MNYEEYMESLDIENAPVAIDGDETMCPNCNIKLVNGICPNCGITKEKIEEEEDSKYERRRERR